jgi:peptidyl-prolyl cis-trans isomerase C
MNLRILVAAALLAPAALMAQNAAKPAAKGKAPGKEAIATVNGVAVPKARMDYMMLEQQSRGMQDTEQTRAMVREELVNREVLQQEAQRAGFAKKADVQTQIDMARQGIIVGAYLRDWARKHPVSDEEVQKEYDRARAQAPGKEYRARHILVDSEDQAKSIIADLKKGAKFDDLARKLSKDDGTKAKGGDLDWQSPGSFDKDFSSAMVKLAKGKYTETPVKTRFGFHVIQLEDSRAAQHPPLAEVKGQISQRLQRARIEAVVAELRAKAKVE